MQCVGSDSGHLHVVLVGWGPLSIEGHGGRPAHQIRWTMQLLVRPRFIVAGTKIEFVPERADVTLTAWTYTSLDSTTFPADADTYLRGAILRDRLEEAAGVRVVDGAVVIGLNITSPTVTTTGDAALLADFARNNDIAAFTNPVAVPVILQDKKASIDAAVAAEGATLDSLSITPADGAFHVSGAGSNSEGSVTFAFEVVPN